MSNAKQQSLWRVAEDEDTCPNDDPMCDGQDAVERGDLPCWDCVRDLDNDEWADFVARRDDR